jgi:hypothetical protein
MAIAFFCTKKPKTNPKLKNEMILKVFNWQVREAKTNSQNFYILVLSV